MTFLKWDPQAWEEYLYWQQTDKGMLRQVNKLVQATLQTPYDGPGRPEPLKHQFSGMWSRRIDKEHRLVYAYDEEEDTVVILQCHAHYKK